MVMDQPDGERLHSAHWLIQQRYGLSQLESDVAEGIWRGWTDKALAEKRGIKVTEVSDVGARVRAKMGALKRQDVAITFSDAYRAADSAATGAGATALAALLSPPGSGATTSGGAATVSLYVSERSALTAAVDSLEKSTGDSKMLITSFGPSPFGRYPELGARWTTALEQRVTDGSRVIHLMREGVLRRSLIDEAKLLLRGIAQKVCYDLRVVPDTLGPWGIPELVITDKQVIVLFRGSDGISLGIGLSPIDPSSALQEAFGRILYDELASERGTSSTSAVSEVASEEEFEQFFASSLQHLTKDVVLVKRGFTSSLIPPEVLTRRMEAAQAAHPTFEDRDLLDRYSGSMTSRYKAFAEKVLTFKFRHIIRVDDVIDLLKHGTPFSDDILIQCSHSVFSLSDRIAYVNHVIDVIDGNPNLEIALIDDTFAKTIQADLFMMNWQIVGSIQLLFEYYGSRHEESLSCGQCTSFEQMCNPPHTQGIIRSQPVVEMFGLWFNLWWHRIPDRFRDRTYVVSRLRELVEESTPT